MEGNVFKHNSIFNSFGKSGSNYVKASAPTDIMYCTAGLLKLNESDFSFDL
jgi:hypothetical protein